MTTLCKIQLPKKFIKKEGIMPMRKSINIMVGIRVIFAFISVLLFSIMVTKNINLIEKNETANEQVNALLSRAQQAETAH